MASSGLGGACGKKCRPEAYHSSCPLHIQNTKYHLSPFVIGGRLKSEQFQNGLDLKPVCMVPVPVSNQTGLIKGDVRGERMKLLT